MKHESKSFEQARKMLRKASLQIINEDLSRPWGGFIVIDEKQSREFIECYFPDEDLQFSSKTNKLSPKLLIVAPGKRLSWQYHNRRAEMWRCLRGKVGVITSITNIEGKINTLSPGEKIQIQQGERHRLVGLDDWGIVAEIWIHSLPNHPSDEEDIIRLQDDFNR